MMLRPRRSVLYVPGDNERALEKTQSLAADAIIIDLEDSVAPSNKEQARVQATEAIRRGGFGSREIILRVNPIETPWGMADLPLARTERTRIRAMCAPGDVQPEPRQKTLRSQARPER